MWESILLHNDDLTNIAAFSIGIIVQKVMHSLAFVYFTTICWYITQLYFQDLYNIGGRKFVITGLGPLGCIPNQIGYSDNTSSCVESTNCLATIFNTKLKELVDQHNSNLVDACFLYWDAYSSTLDIINNYLSYGSLLPSKVQDQIWYFFPVIMLNSLNSLFFCELLAVFRVQASAHCLLWGGPCKGSDHMFASFASRMP